MRYRLEGNTIVVSPDTPYVKTYRVNYVNMTRETTSNIGVSGEIARPGRAVVRPGGAGGASGSSTKVTYDVSKNDFWDQLRDNIRSILNSTRLQSLSAEAKGERLALVKQEQEMRVKQIEAASRAGQGASALASSVVSAGSGAQQQASLLPDDVVVNAISGTVTVNATEKQHQLVQQHIDSIVNAMQRQVLIEATIVEVALSEQLPGGHRLEPAADHGRADAAAESDHPASSRHADLPKAPLLLPDRLCQPRTSGLGNISATVKLLQQFGNTRVLSSPKLMALNNQTALLKVVDNIVYFEVRLSTTSPGRATGARCNLQHHREDGGGRRRHERDAADQRRWPGLADRAADDHAPQPEQPFVNDPNPEPRAIRCRRHLQHRGQPACRKSRCAKWNPCCRSAAARP